MQTDDDSGLLTIQQYCVENECSPAYVYLLLARRELVGVKDGRRTKITRASAKARRARLQPFKSAAKTASA